VRVEAVVADLDGTLVGGDFNVSRATLESLRTLRAAGIPLVIATGRVPQDLRALDCVVRDAEVTVCCSGSIGRAAQRALWQDGLMPEAIAHVVATAVAYGAGVAGFDGSAWRLTERYVQLGPAGGYRAPRVAVPAGVLTATSCVTMSVVHEERGVLAALARDLDGVVGTGLSRVAGLDILDITARAVDKGVGVLRALQVIGADPAAAVSFGDMPNDIPMFAVTGRAYAVGRSHPEVAAAADEVLAPVEHDGFASKINSLAASQWRIG
jgi:hydroxymethylpyrimidine pyrophosphatase-like HAD family hydrolase